MTRPHNPEDNPTAAFHLPPVNETTIEFSRTHPRDFDKLFSDLQHTHPNVARFILTRTEQLAPANIRSKEALARLALEVLDLFSTQQEVNTLEEMLRALPGDTDIDMPSDADGVASDLPPAV